MNLKAELGNLYNNLINANMNINSNGPSNRNNIGKLYIKEGYKNNKFSDKNISNFFSKNY